MLGEFRIPRGVIGSVSGLPVWDPSNNVLFWDLLCNTCPKEARESKFQTSHVLRVEATGHMYLYEDDDDSRTRTN